MLRFIAPIALLVLTFAAAPADAKVKLANARSQCDKDALSATFRGSMWSPSREGTMEMRFWLQSRTEADPRWSDPKQPKGFGVWLAARPGVRHYVVDKTVTGLAEGAVYRVVVKFRWRDAAGEVVDRAARRTRACRQPDHRADLVIERVSILEGTQPGTKLYIVRVANDGDSEAPLFATALEVNETVLPQETTEAPLAEGEWTDLEFEGPPCESGSSLVARTDTGGAVDEVDEADNGLTVPCPGPTVTIG